MLLDDDDIEQYVTIKFESKGQVNKQALRCVIFEIKTSQFCKPFRDRKEAEEKIDMAFEWYMDHVCNSKST